MEATKVSPVRQKQLTSLNGDAYLSEEGFFLLSTKSRCPYDRHLWRASCLPIKGMSVRSASQLCCSLGSNRGPVKGGYISDGHRGVILKTIR